MDWRHLVYTILRGVLKFVADEYYPVGSFGRRGGHANKGKASTGKASKASKRPNKEAPPQPPREEPVHSAGWAPPQEAAAATVILLETDAGSTVAAASFIGDECFGITKVERVRQPGESRRTRRKAQPVPTSEAESAETPAAMPPLHPLLAERREQLRQWGNAQHARQQAEFQRQADEVMAQRQAAQAQAQRAVEAPHGQTVASPARRAGGPRSVTGLTPETLLLIELGEPLTYVHAAA